MLLHLYHHIPGPCGVHTLVHPDPHYAAWLHVNSPCVLLPRLSMARKYIYIIVIPLSLPPPLLLYLFISMFKRITVGFPRRLYTTMSTSKQEYLVIVKDKPNTFAKRMEVRQQHLTTIKVNVQAQGPGYGPYTSGGGISEDKDEDLFGSTLTIEADSKEEVREMLKEDIYYKHGVWDVDNAQIYAVSIKWKKVVSLMLTIL